MPADEKKPERDELDDVPLREDPTIRVARVAANRPDDGEAFLPDPYKDGTPVPVTDAESFGEEFVASATTGEPLYEDAADEVTEEEEGGPFLELDSDEDIPEATGSEIPAPIPRNPRRSLPR